MKISLKFLLGLVLLAALAVSCFINFRTAEVIRVDCENLESSIASAKKSNQFFEERKLVYLRAFDGFKLRKEKLLNTPEFFESVAQMHRKMETKPDLIQVFSISGARHENFLHERFRIGLPESPRFELCLGYHNAGFEKKLPPELRDSYYFSPQKLFSLPLNPGQSLIEFKVPYETGTPSTHLVEVIVNGEVVHEAKRLTVRPYWQLAGGGRRSDRRSDLNSKIVSVFSSEDQEFAAEPLRLVTVNAWPTKDDPEGVSLILRPIGGESK